MNETIIISEQVSQQFSARATLVGMGVKLRNPKVLEPLQERVRIAKKTVKYTPLEMLPDGLIAILAGAHGLVEINKRVQSDPVLHAAFGRKGFAEQSVVQETQDVCTAENMSQIHQAVDQIYRRHS
jgi:1-deoxy-D-xylulose 5-phosphate reductoisomerase